MTLDTDSAMSKNHSTLHNKPQSAKQRDIDRNKGERRNSPERVHGKDAEIHVGRGLKRQDK